MNFASGRLNNTGALVSVEEHRIIFTRYFYDKGELRCEADVKTSPLKGVGTWLPSEGRWEWMFYA